MTEPEAELQATANLSPVSPSPLYTTAPRVVPALQNTVDTIDAMVAAAASSDAMVDAILDPAILEDANGAGQVVDDDSLDDAYDDQVATDAPAELAPRSQLEPLDSNDDYAKTFDSPFDPEEGGEQGLQHQHHVPSSSMPPKSNNVSLQPDPLNSSGAPDAVLDHVAHGASPDATPSGTQLEPPGPPTESSHSEAQTETSANQDLTYAESQDSSVDLQKLVADLTAQPTEPSSDAEPSSSPVSAKAEQPTAAASQTSPISLPSSSSLPPRPPLPQSGSQTYASQQHAAALSPTAAVPSPGAALPATGAPPSFPAGGPPGTSTEAVGSLLPSPAAGSNALPLGTHLNALSQASQAATGFSQGWEPDANYQRQWDQFMTDERQYMSDAKWDRFPEGSRIFIGTGLRR